MKKKRYIKPGIKKEMARPNFYIKQQYGLLAECTGGCPSGCSCDDNRPFFPGVCVDGASCFLPGTKILMADNSLKSIESVKAGDLILSYDINTKEIVRSEVKKLLVHKDDPSGYLSINDRLNITGHHRIFVKEKGWLPAASLKLDDQLLTSEKNWITVRNIRKAKGTNTVYNLSIKEVVHNFFAEGILVHNLKTC